MFSRLFRDVLVAGINELVGIVQYISTWILSQFESATYVYKCTMVTVKLETHAFAITECLMDCTHS